MIIRLGSARNPEEINLVLPGSVYSEYLPPTIHVSVKAELGKDTIVCPAAQPCVGNSFHNPFAEVLQHLRSQ